MSDRHIIRFPKTQLCCSSSLGQPRCRVRLAIQRLNTITDQYLKTVEESLALHTTRSEVVRSDNTAERRCQLPQLIGALLRDLRPFSPEFLHVDEFAHYALRCADAMERHSVAETVTPQIETVSAPESPSPSSLFSCS